MVSNRKKRRPDRRAADLTAERIASLAEEAVSSPGDDENDLELQSLYYAQLEEELQGRERELTRLRELERNASPDSVDSIRRLVSKAELAVDLQEQRVNAYLEKRPWLQAQTDEADPWEGEDEEEHPPETDWRQHLLQMMRDRQSGWQGELSAEQEKKLAEWRQAELTSIEEKYRHLEESLVSRQQQLESAWSSQLQTIELQKLREWMNQERERTLSSLREDLAKERAIIEERSRVSRQELLKEMEQLAQQMLEQQTNELRLLEIEWREQEVIQRERPKLRQLWAELAAEQEQSMVAALAEMRRQLLESQQAASQEWLREQAVHWAKKQDEWLHQISEEQQQLDRLRWSEQQEQLIRRTEQLLGEFQQQLAGEAAKTEERMLRITADWDIRSDEALRQARANWQRGQEEQIALLQREWTRQLAAEVRQNQSDWLAAKQSWAKAVEKDWAKLQQQAMPELRQLMNDWIKEQTQSLGNSKRQLEQQTAEQIRQSKQLLDKTLEQYSKRFGEVQDAIDRLVQNESAHLASIREQQNRLCDEQQQRADLALQTVQQQWESQLAKDKAATSAWLQEKSSLLANLTSQFEQRVTLQMQATDQNSEELALRQEKRLTEMQIAVHGWLETGAANLKQTQENLLAEHHEAVSLAQQTLVRLQSEYQAQLGESKGALEAWLKAQTEVLATFRQSLSRQQELQAATAEQTLKQRLEELKTQQGSLSAELISRFTSELAKGHTDLLRKTSEQLQAQRAKTELLLSQRLAEALEQQRAEGQRQLHSQVENAVQSLQVKTEEACQGIKTRYEDQLASLTETVRRELQQQAEQAQLSAERIQREHWMQAFDQMLEQQREELQQTVTEADQRLLEQLRSQIRTEIRAELAERQQEEQKAKQEQAEQQRTQRTTRRQR